MCSIKLICVFILIVISFSVFVHSDYADDYCSENKCIYKCCDRNEYMNDTLGGVCVEINETLDYDNIQLYDDVESYQLSNVNFKDVFKLRLGKMQNQTFADESINAEITENAYLSKRGVLYLELPNVYNRWTVIPNNDFCLEYVELDSEFIIQHWVMKGEDSQEPFHDDTSNKELNRAILIASCVFLSLLLLVYAMISELRNIGGLVLMAYVFSLLGAFSTQISFLNNKKNDYEDTTCIALTTLIYFFYLAAFFWMNVMSFDIWWTFRGYAKARPIHRKGETFKFCMYSLYAWGVPLLMTVGFAWIDSADLRHMPWIVQPNIVKNGCFIHGVEKVLYLYTPMSILIVCNWLFYLMTAVNVWRLSRGTTVLHSPAAGNPASHRSQKQRFSVYLKLSVVMGINWTLEVVTFYFPNNNMSYIADTYNRLIGFIIFIIFVFKQSIYKKLLIRFKSLKRINFPKRSRTLIIPMDSLHPTETSSTHPDLTYRERKLLTSPSKLKF